MDEGEHRIARLFVDRLRHHRVKLVLGLEIGAGVPVRTGDNIDLAVSVDVGGVDAVAEVRIVENDLLERDRRAKERERQDGEKRGESEVG
jgi:hypothetical protein